jgi:HK97 family phage major capsid protein
MPELNVQSALDQLTTEVKGFMDRSKEEIKANGAMSLETKTALESLAEQQKLIVKRLDTFEAKQQKPPEGGQLTLIEELKSNDDLARIVRDGRGSARFELKTTISSSAVGSGTAGVLMPELILPGILPAAQANLTMRSVLPSAPTGANVVFFVKENAFTSAASPQTEASDKGESALTFTTDTATVQTIAHWIPATKQVLDDFPGLAAFLQTKMRYGLEKKIDAEILSGSGTGLHLSGLTTDATAFDTNLLSATAGWTRIDIIGRAIQQVETADETPSTFIVLNPADWWKMKLTKDSYGRYIIGEPGSDGTPPMLWGRPVVVTTQMASGYFLVGAASAAMIRNRQGVTVDISTEHSDFFIKNMVAVRVEARLALPVFRPAAFIYGALNSSPTT